MDEQTKIVATPDVLIYCSTCYDVGAPEYRLRRKSGKYILLCYKQGDGCWERYPQPVCEFKDHQGVQCVNSAEWEVAYGQNQIKTQRCVLHVGPALNDVDEHRVYGI